MNSIDQVLKHLQPHFTLIDVGASGSAPQIWKALAPYADYFGFDPDLREISLNTQTPYRNYTVINKAITDSTDATHINFFLTNSPYCSSTLEPNHAHLAHYAYADLFRVLGQEEVSSTTLNQVAAEQHLDRIHWLKLDTQGTDLRILNSLDSALSRTILAIDVEPGLQANYLNEDTFDEIQAVLLQRGYWLTDLRVLGAQRIQPKTYGLLPLNTAHDLQARLKSSPLWVEARYLRTIESLEDEDSLTYCILWIFSMLDGQRGFALDIAAAYQARFGSDKISTLLRNGALEMPFSPRRWLATHTPSALRSIIRRLLR